jgi:hypothetical protein
MIQARARQIFEEANGLCASLHERTAVISAAIFSRSWLAS